MEHFEKLWEEAGGGICGKRACEKYYREALKWAYQESLDNYDSSDFRFTLKQECPELAGDDMPWN